MPVFDTRSSMQVYRMEKKNNNHSPLSALSETISPTGFHSEYSSGETHYVSMIARLTSVNSLDSLVELGAIVFHTRGDMALLCLPEDKVADLGQRHYVDNVSLSHSQVPTLEISRSKTGVDAIHTGAVTGLPAGIDGTGVVAGICDIGIDPNHPAFSNRIGMMAVYVDSLALRQLYCPGSDLHNMDELATDDAENTHGTHVLNILGGSSAGTPYGGYAPGTILCPTGSQLSDFAMLCGIEDIIAYARERNMPAVVNISTGFYLGPHDGTDLVNRYLDLLGEEALICFSAGNNSHRRFSLEHVFSAESPAEANGLPAVGSMFENRATWDGFDINGALDIWSANNHPFQVRFVAYDQIEGKFVYLGPWLGPDFEDESLDNPSASGRFYVDSSLDNDILKYFPGTELSVAWGTDALNHRYMAALDYSVRTEAELPGHHWARYVMGWQARAPHGTHIYAYTEGITSFLRKYGVPGQIDGDGSQTISNTCCGKAVMAVGSWNSRNTVPVWPDSNKTLDFTVNNVSEWSSYGTLVDGRILPHICAPGNTVISAMSSEFHAKYQDVETAHMFTGADGKCYAYYETAGTSMAAPATAGILALWLQVYPQLTINQAIEIAQRTANTNFPDIANPRWGAGAIDAVKGIAEVMKISGVHSISTSSVPKAQIVVKNRCISVIPAPGSTQIPHTIISDLSGRTFATDSPLVPGIYIVKADSQTYKIQIR